MLLQLIQTSASSQLGRLSWRPRHQACGWRSPLLEFSARFHRGTVDGGRPGRSPRKSGESVVTQRGSLDKVTSSVLTTFTSSGFDLSLMISTFKGAGRTNPSLGA